jgi:hypothetical protein
MKRREFLTGLAVGAGIATPAMAQDYVASIVRQLKRQGFRAIVQERTLLGRIRIVASRKDGRREIIVNPKSGEILRDLWMPVAGGGGEVSMIGGDDRSDDDDDDDDGGGGDDGDDDDDDDDDGGGGDDGGGDGDDDGDGGGDDGDDGGGDSGSGGGDDD